MTKIKFYVIALRFGEGCNNFSLWTFFFNFSLENAEWFDLYPLAYLDEFLEKSNYSWYDLFRTKYFQLKFIASNRGCWLLQRMLQPAGKREYADRKLGSRKFKTSFLYLKDITKKRGNITNFLVAKWGVKDWEGNWVSIQSYFPFLRLETKTTVQKISTCKQSREE